jgi:hypothetical protein
MKGNQLKFNPLARFGLQVGPAAGHAGAGRARGKAGLFGSYPTEQKANWPRIAGKRRPEMASHWFFEARAGEGRLERENAPTAFLLGTAVFLPQRQKSAPEMKISLVFPR